jgi:hypothetical protein
MNTGLIGCAECLWYREADITGGGGREEKAEKEGIKTW